MKHLVEFAPMDWVAPAAGVRYKAFVQGNQRIRLVEFSEGFVEPHWCLNGHAGYVLDGSFTIDYNGQIEHYQKGDVIFIPKGENDKHKVIMQPGGWVQLLLFEIMDEKG
jgi:quercetin dioxygenase-like cupin family protein